MFRGPALHRHCGRIDQRYFNGCHCQPRLYIKRLLHFILHFSFLLSCHLHSSSPLCSPALPRSATVIVFLVRYLLHPQTPWATRRAFVAFSPARVPPFIFPIFPLVLTSTTFSAYGQLDSFTTSSILVPWLALVNIIWDFFPSIGSYAGLLAAQVSPWSASFKSGLKPLSNKVF